MTHRATLTLLSLTVGVCLAPGRCLAQTSSGQTPGQWPASAARPQGAPEPDAEAPSRALFAVEEAGLLRPGQFEAGLLLDNYDRDPLGIDVVDGLVRCRLGIAEALEVRLDYQLTRSVSTPGSHPAPSPPLDIIVADGALASGPYRAMYWPMPFLSHKPARVDDMVPGEYTLGFKGALLRQRGLRPALGLTVAIAIPGDMSRYELSKGSGSGTLDIGLHSALSWRFRRLDVAANLGATLNGVVDPGDQLIVVGEPRATPIEIRRPHFLQSGVGGRLRLGRGLSALAEVSGWAPVGGHTHMQGECGAADALAGVEVRVRRFTLTLGLRQHLRPERNGVSLPTGPLAGAVDFSDLPEDVRAPLLASIGAENRRPDANVVVLGWSSETPLPEGAHRIPSTYLTSTTGNAGFHIRVTVRLGH